MYRASTLEAGESSCSSGSCRNLSSEYELLLSNLGCEGGRAVADESTSVSSMNLVFFHDMLRNLNSHGHAQGARRGRAMTGLRGLGGLRGEEENGKLVGWF